MPLHDLPNIRSHFWRLCVLAALRYHLPTEGLHMAGGASGATSYDLSGDFRHSNLFIESEVHVELPPPPPYDPLPPPDPTGPLPKPGDLPPASLIPYGRNPLFTGREGPLRALWQDLSGGGVAATPPPDRSLMAAIILTGLGGVGKTQLAVEFAHRYGRFFQSVHWVSLADAGAVPSAVAECGRRMGLHPAFGGLPLPDQVALTEQAWAGPERRLLIFDNCEEPALLERWRPKSGGGRVLVTSRAGRWRVPGVTVQTLDVLSEQEAVALIERHVPRPPRSAHPQMRAPGSQMPALLPPSASEDADSDWSATLKAIAAELGYLALALHLAGSYLAYLLDTLGGDPAARAAELLARLRDPALLEHAALTGAGAGVSPTDHVQHVGRTFALSYERLGADQDETGALATALLARAACLAPGAPFPVWLLRATVDLPEGEDGGRALAAALERLMGVGLLEGTGVGGYRLHRLVGRFVEERVSRKDLEGARGALEEVAGRTVYKQNEEGDPRVISVWETHLRHITDRAITREENTAAKLANNFGYYLVLSGNITAARKYYERALAIKEHILGPSDPSTATTLSNLGSLLQDLGDFPQARSCHERALDIYERVFGPDHPDTATSLNNLGTLLLTLNDLTTARLHLERALAIRWRVLGPDHLHTAQSLGNWGTVLQADGKLAEAQSYYERALTIRKHILGTEHPDIATNLAWLGTLLRKQGNLIDAKPYYEQALAIRERILGPNHPDTAATANNMGLLLQELGDFVEARLYLERALNTLESIFGYNHFSLAVILYNLAVLYAYQGDFLNAISHMRRALAIREKVLGPQHPDTIKTRTSLAAIEAAMGEG